MPIVTVSRGTKSGGKALAERVAASLGCACIAREVLAEGAAKLGVSDEFLREKLERSPRLWERLTAERKTYVLACQSVLADHAARGDFVYHGLAGHLLLREVPEVLRVRLVTPLEVRIHALVEQGMTPADAAEYIAELDQSRARWTRLLYHADVEDPRLYDLVLNVEKATVESAACAVVAMAGRPEFTLGPEARVRCADVAVAAHVRLALELHPSSRGLGLEVEAHEGVVTLAGSIPQAQLMSRASARWLEELRQIAGAASGVQEVVLRVNVVDAYR